MNIEYIEKAVELSKHSNCSRRRVAALAVKDDKILLTAFNETIIPQTSCNSIHSCIRANVPSGDRLEHCWAIHAEQALIVQALDKGISLKDTLIYCTTQPCSTCCKLLIMAGVAGIYYTEPYPTEFTEKLIEEVNQHRSFIFEQVPYDKKRKKSLL